MPRKPNPELVDDEWTEADFARARPAAEVLREQFGAGAEHLLKPKHKRSVKPVRSAARQRRKPVRAKRRVSARA
jgi:hypothetical protein